MGLQLGRLGIVGLNWSERALWPLGAASPGMRIDGPSYPAACYQDSAGTTALSTVGAVLDSSNPVGLVLDRKGGLALGAELVTNGDFSNGTTGWTVTGTALIDSVGGVGRLTVGTPITALQDRVATNEISGLTVGKSYKVSAVIYAGTSSIRLSVTGVRLGGDGTGVYVDNTTTTPLQKEIVFVATDTTMYVRMVALNGTAGYTAFADSISVREIPGLHLSQSTSAARPVASGRVNLLTNTEDIGAAPWGNVAGTVAYVANKLIPAAATNYMGRRYSLTSSDKPVSTFSAYLKEGDSGVHAEIFVGPSVTAIINLSTWATLSSTGASVAFGEYDENGYRKVSITSLAAITPLTFIDIRLTASSTSNQTFAGDGSKGYYCTKVQFNTGPATTYQAVDTDSSYIATGFPQYLKFDGVDDALSSATFAAGTLTSSMDCLIAVRRDSAAATYLISDTVSRGFFEWESGDTNRPDVGAGMPTYYVDGVACTATRGALFTALAAGSWHILEARGLDLSTWTAFGVSSFVSYRLNGGLGGIQLFASGQDANRDKARAAMAAYFGVTLA